MAESEFLMRTSSGASPWLTVIREDSEKRSVPAGIS